MTEYQPGVCNINQNESRKRYISGGLGFLLAAVSAILYGFQGMSTHYLVAVLIFSVFGSIGIIQGRKNFCIAHASQGTRKTGEETEEVKDDNSLSADRKTALKTGLEAFISGLLITLAVHLFFLII